MAHIETFGHGGDLRTASAAFGVPEDQLLDFSANINPLGPPPDLMKRLVQDMGRLVHYPDPAHRGLIKGLAKKYGVSERMLAVGNGAAECMALVLLALAPRTVGVIYPSFVEYTQLARQFGARVVSCTGRAEDGFLPTLPELHMLIKQVDLVFIGHPNNPTGLMYDVQILRKLAAWADEFGTYVVIDEAFLDFLPESQQPTLIGELGRYPRVILIRSMTKFYAIPGLRLGFAVAAPALIRKLKGKQVPWSVNALALAAGEVCCEQNEYETATRLLVDTERAYLIGRIREWFGWRVWPGKANFLLIRLHKEMTADTMQLALGKRGIMIRSCAMYPGLTPHDIRIAVRLREENDRLLEAFGAVLVEGGQL
ncbi:L-threonine O-3-phosphate decarboxylase [Aneurinibacillus soli]|uniref:threonine-phosphate decarboxylase n=1 Tax=Aneurinibacillus soli TaxID=1500254 RepID=A0A0U5B0D0_9BACL|nr:threonine-phosphate decarboxylase CobD [Aneurinibacillus soli]PYE59291.1 L-threonine O-3-phosphate decarboxylase [Aneurinibacillus soli]BAU26719.1 Threonine-phosphate decarboxylase [Aneurinibacillus soli]